MTARRAFLTGRLWAAETPALAPEPEAASVRRGARIGAACLSVNGVACRLCEEQCEPSAIRFRLATGGRAIPFIDLARCDGCGACAAPCPVGAVTIVAPSCCDPSTESTS